MALVALVIGNALQLSRNPHNCHPLRLKWVAGQIPGNPGLSIHLHQYCDREGFIWELEKMRFNQVWCHSHGLPEMKRRLARFQSKLDVCWKGGWFQWESGTQRRFQWESERFPWKTQRRLPRKTQRRFLGGCSDFSRYWELARQLIIKDNRDDDNGTMVMMKTRGV